MKSQIGFLINQAVQNLSSGNLESARLYLNQAFRLDQQNTHVLRLMGVIHAHKSEWDQALDFLHKSIKANPKNGIAYSNLGNIFLELKKYEEAITNYDKAIALEPKYAEAWSNKGNALSKLKLLDQAVLAYEKAIALNPHYAEAWTHKGNALNELGRYEEALLAYQQALTINPNYADAWSNAGNSLTEIKQYEAAFTAYEKAITANPKYAEAWTNKSNLLSKLNRNEEAITCCKNAIAIDPEYTPAYSNLAAYQAALFEYDLALKSAEKAIALDPTYAKAWLNKGSVLNYLGDYTQAMTCFDRAIDLQPNYPDAWANKGVSHYELLNLEDSIACCNKAIESDPSYIDSYWNKSFAQLMLGRFDEGWVNYEYRWRRNNTDQYLYPNLPALTSLSDLRNKKILVWAEQGFGDTLQFARYIPKLIELGAQVTFEVQGALNSLFQNQYACTLISKGDPIGDIDLQTPLLSLPLLFQTDLHSIPSNTPYIQVSPKEIEKWKNKLPLEKNKLNIGIACSGNINFDLKHGNKRPIPLISFSKLAKEHNLFLIQKEIRESDQATLITLGNIHYLGDLIHHFEDSAAIIENMDLIISIDTSLAHLAGALGKKMIVLLPWCPDWRWLATGASNPWYQEATLIRQSNAGDWNPVIEKLEEILGKI